MTGRMFSFITHTHNLDIYPCEYGCTYCWAEKYRGRYLLPKVRAERWERHFKAGDFVFINDLFDTYQPSVPDYAVDGYHGFIGKSPDARFLLLTKNPARYLLSMPPINAILGCTLESDLDYLACSRAPPQSQRMKAIEAVTRALQDSGRPGMFISIEPALAFSPCFLNWLIDIEPWAVAVGYDNHGHLLPEPPLCDAQALIDGLQSYGIRVYQKTLRRAWNE